MRNRSFRYLVVGQSLANGGDLFYIVGLMALLYNLSQSSFYMALIPFVVTISRLVCGLFVPILLDKYELKKLLFVSQLWKSVLLLFLGALVAFFISNDTLLHIFIFVSFISFLDGVAHPARNAMIPRLIEESDLVRANSILSVIDQTIQFGGWAAGGVLASFLPPSHLIWLTFLLFVGSTFCMWKMKNVYLDNVAKETNPSVWNAMKEGWIYIFHHKWLRSFHAMVLLESMAGAVWIAAILYVYAAENLRAGTSWWGYINASFFAGFIVGGIIAWKISYVIQKHLFFSIFLGSLGTSIITFVFGMNTVAFLSLVFSFVYGLFEQLKVIGMQAILQKNVSDFILPKVYAAQQVVMTISFGGMTLFFGWITEIYGPKVVFAISASFLLLSSLFCFTFLSSSYKMEKGVQNVK
ncbi:MFS family permease [Anoxybacillus calidus]|uniref:MFS family permease n=1 Tax=[Anoxybacillus] calidus TaxID=575178 RepID=A0A7W0BU04_9BACL|nr:MFS transporter [Anoxybacillus calidus]MBA2870293.1 MFS family permease [Anoxybacillus calidus]